MTTGGFLRAGNTTLLVGVEDDKVTEPWGSSKGLQVPETDGCLSRAHGGGRGVRSYPIEVTVGGATIFVLNVENFVRSESMRFMTSTAWTN